ncbi:YdcH family protein [Malaciobacter marinus]|uniref:DUF465 domain-containing protein n=1 Tax=Malaciobacter marinus TaxID=505249 RepID=A0A347TLZ6_9BACT|nr:MULTISPECIES: DUF465 domain-containing protein [Malaciobacter]AXX87624.1 DUF465 domain-containing protein [Malaciobacter marinus]PHO12178.1 hypothetical protein CPG38_09060 [Malaciobacter marinus]PHO14274.1 hypothetical protein CPH92_12655 [Malaciobacter marinus]RYA24880.1 DUF465 domain-containing protein [Malaciobacter halophilus]
MFHEHRDVITKLKQENAHFHKLFDKHNELDEEIIELEKNFGDQLEIDKKKKEKLKLKDEVFNLIMEYEKS